MALTSGAVEAAREAVARRGWGEAYELLAAADAEGELSGAELESLADAAYWSGRHDEALAARERAYARHMAAGETLRAAAMALTLAIDYNGKGATAFSGGWFAKGERLLEGLPESREHGLASTVRAMAGIFAGRFEEAAEQARLTYELGRRLGDRDLVAFGLVQEGVALVYLGRYDEGLRLLDEASTAAVAGELSPFSSCLVYCMTITSCHALGDYDRARQWTDAAHRWCTEEGTTGFPGACRVHRSEILQLGGDWERAETEALGACRELQSYDVFTASAGYYQVGEIRRRRGDFAAAEEAYAKAHELGREPQPGRALLRLAQGKAQEAAAALRRSLDDHAHDPFERARSLPAQIEISLALGDLEGARAAAEELERIAEQMKIAGRRTPLLDGPLQLGRGQIELAAERWEEAAGCLRRAVAIWSGIGAPYETAQARLALGAAYAQLGDEAGAREELQAARAAFARLGAVLDEQRALELLGEASARRTFLFSDIVDSTKLLEALGDGKWAKLLDRHDAILRQGIEAAGGEVIKHTGDGFFAAFDAPAAAVRAASDIQRSLEDEFVSVRIGLHSGDAVDRGNDYAGIGVTLAARVGALAGSGEILASKETVAGGAYVLGAARKAELKGFAEPVEVVSVEWR